MRILTTLIMLCLPMTAMGEIYVCSSEKYATLSDLLSFARTRETKLTDYVVDTESGFRALTDDASYRGECQTAETSTTIVCSYEDGLSAMQVYIDRSDLIFTYSQHLYGGSVRSYFGKCTEI